METVLAELLKKFPEYEIAAKGDWKNVPVTTRKDLEQWSFAQCKAKPVLMSMTSGSTGKPLTIFHSKTAMEAKVARAIELFAPIIGESNHLFFNMLGRFCITKKTAELGFYELQKMCISFGIPSKKNAEAIAMAVQMKQPDGIIATTGGLSSLLELGITITTRYAFVGGSLAPEAFRKRVISMLKCRYIDTYACNEFGVVAADFQEEGLVAGSGILLEVQRQDGSIAEEGTGNLLVTDYTNYAMPFIRYAIGDKIELNNKDGKKFIKILGRSDQLTNFDQVLVSIPKIVESVKEILGHEKFYISIKNNEDSLYDEARLHIPPEDIGKENVLSKKLYDIMGRMPKVVAAEKFFHAPNGKFINFFDLRKASGAHW